jgi:hypothetical protein
MKAAASRNAALEGGVPLSSSIDPAASWARSSSARRSERESRSGGLPAVTLGTSRGSLPDRFATPESARPVDVKTVKEMTSAGASIGRAVDEGSGTDTIALTAGWKRRGGGALVIS